MRSRRIIIVLGLIAPLFMWGGVSNSAKALTVSPVRFEMKADPGQTLEAEITVHNEQRESREYFFDFQSFESRDESGNPVLFRSRSGLPSWMSVERESISLGPGERQNVAISIAVPSDAEPGGYFAAVLLASSPPRLTDDNSAVGLASQVGSLVLLRVSGDLAEDANILEFGSKSGRRVFKSLPIDFYIRFQNSGDTWSKPVGDVVIENLWGGTSKIIPANPEGGNVLPASIRRFEPSWLTPKSQGEVENPEAERLVMPEKYWDRVKFEWQNAPLGRFTARLTLNFGAGNSLRESKEFVFWVVPWELLIVVVPAAIVALLIIVFAIKRYNRYIVARDRRKRH